MIKQLGNKFEQIRYIIDRVEDKTRVGVCIDTCHTYSAGYDIATPEAFNETFMQFDNIIGFNYLRGIHLNDTKKPLASRVDRHESIGLGLLAGNLFSLLMRDERFDELPIILETPDDTKWAEEIAYLKSLAE